LISLYGAMTKLCDALMQFAVTLLSLLKVSNPPWYPPLDTIMVFLFAYALTSARAVRFASVPELENRSSRYWRNESKKALPDDLQTCLLLPDQIRYRGRNAWPW
jgi:hypothetical protein